MSEAAPGALDLVRALLLGALQGATEFLPVSSSGHLVIVPELAGWPSAPLAFDVLVHLATALAVVLYTRRDWAAMARAVWRGARSGAPFGSADGRLALQLVVANVPAAVVGLGLEEAFAALLGSDPRTAARGAAAMLLVTAVMLVVADRPGAAPRPERAEGAPIPWRAALIVGVAQAVAIVPGISRSGSTIAAGMLAGLSRAEATRFSFLLGAPIMVGAGLLALAGMLGGAETVGRGESLGAGPLVVGMLAAGLVGYAAIDWLLRWVRGHSLRPFAAYTAAAGLLALLALR